MNKNFLVSFLAVMTALSGVTYFTLSDKNMSLRDGQVSTSEVYTQWLWWLQTYGKQYQHAELPLKFNTFKNNYVLVKQHNADTTQNYKLGMNQFADLDNTEFATLQQNQYRGHSLMDRVKVLSTDSVPESVDWRTKDAVTPIKNQGQCGSCWAFSTTGSLEGLHAIKKGSLLSFSEQQLVDCSDSYGNQGCNGGLMDDAFKYVMAKGIELESTYPYTGTDGTCAYSASKVAFTNTGYQDVTSNSSSQLQAAAAQQPISIAIAASSFNFQLYSSGVFDYTGCGDQLDHGVLVVGYDLSASSPYWIVKNSWGASWGMSGYVEMAALANGTPGMCGMYLEPSYPTLSS